MCIFENLNGKNIWNYFYVELGVKFVVDFWMIDYF